MTVQSFVAFLLCTAALPAVSQQQTGAPAGIAAPTPPPASSTVDPAAAEAVPASRIFRVHIADGRTGEAVSGARIQLWYDEPAGPGYAVMSGARGDAAMPKPVGEPIRVLVAVSGYTDCRKPDRDAPPEGYNLADIASKGIAAGNTCGHIAVRTGPGELVVYVRPSHWYENLNKTPM
jgi:hypothetical protein